MHFVRLVITTVSLQRRRSTAVHCESRANVRTRFSAFNKRKRTFTRQNRRSSVGRHNTRSSFDPQWTDSELQKRLSISTWLGQNQWRRCLRKHQINYNLTCENHHTTWFLLMMRALFKYRSRTSVCGNTLRNRKGNCSMSFQSLMCTLFCCFEYVQIFFNYRLPHYWQMKLHRRIFSQEEFENWGDLNWTIHRFTKSSHAAFDNLRWPVHLCENVWTFNRNFVSKPGDFPCPPSSVGA